MRHIKGHIITVFPLFLVLILLPSYIPIVNLAQASSDEITLEKYIDPLPEGPTLNDANLNLEEISTGLDLPTGMTFVGPNDILVTEKNTGIVKRITNGQLNPEPVLDESIANVKERGMLGIAAAVNSNRNGNAPTNTIGPTYVFLYYTDSSSTTDGDDADSEENVLGSRLYRYELIDNQLVNPKLLLDLPAHPPPDREEASRDHYGGKVLIGPADNYVYVGIGNVIVHQGQAQNVLDGEPLDGTSGILRVGQDGEVQPNPPLGSTQTMSPYYYAYGIRNTFGMDFDPITGKLWDTENGPTYADEINIVEPGFNSGHSKIHGFAKDASTDDSEDDEEDGSEDDSSSEAAINPATDLVNFGGNSQYSDPEFVWTTPLGVTALKFLNSDKLGSQYQNTIFIGDTNSGWLYNFKLNPQRTGL
ncbi:MAG TPA: PQQ-dependent sugar dehydrogenase, partial [Nitrososphaeraceae archaeon]|nr:PQQ-dependent sugar dehydrogenase [Nitrososphaeraceae archaeon]